MSPVDYHAWTHAPKSQGGTDPLSTHPWLAVYDDVYLGQEIPEAVATDLLFPFIDWSDTALKSVFAYDTGDGTAAFGKDFYYIPQINVEGVYTITLACEADTVTAASNYRAFFEVDVGGDYPGRHIGADIRLSAYESVDEAVVGRLAFLRSWTLPIKIVGSPPETITPRVTLVGGGAGWEIIARSRMWITYLGPTDHTGTGFVDSNDPGEPA